MSLVKKNLLPTQYEEFMLVGLPGEQTHIWWPFFEADEGDIVYVQEVTNYGPTGGYAFRLVKEITDDCFVSFEGLTPEHCDRLRAQIRSAVPA